jgi:hypothetical protein
MRAHATGYKPVLRNRKCKTTKPRAQRNMRPKIRRAIATQGDDRSPDGVHAP